MVLLRWAQIALTIAVRWLARRPLFPVGTRVESVLAVPIVGKILLMTVGSLHRHTRRCSAIIVLLKVLARSSLVV